MNTPAGRIAVDWKKTDGSLELEIRSPRGIPVTLALGEQEELVLPEGGEINLSYDLGEFSGDTVRSR
ncbi:MAG: alpha-L-rhamnosidase C-terminal domain-containing protein [Opitutaceae bacterium]